MAIGIVTAVALIAAPVPACATERPRSLLVLEQSDVRGPFYAAIFSGLRATLNAKAKSPVTLYVENLDLSRFGGEDYEKSLQQHFDVKYRDKPIGVVVAVGAAALEYALRWRPALWPDAPIVFSFVDEATISSLDLPADVSGRITRLRLADMVAAARILVPDLAHVAIVGDLFEQQPVFRPFGAEIPDVAKNLDVIDLTGLPMTELKERVATLPDRSAILFTAVYSDGRGTYFAPADALSMIAGVANRPIVGPVESYIGRGATGGYVAIPARIGEESADLALQIIDGHSMPSPRVKAAAPQPFVVDWREMQRWGIDEHSLPEAADIRYRTPSVWQQYPLQIAGAITVVLLQSALIAALLYEHRRRRIAEVEALARLNELAHVNRFAMAGELSASIAHQLNQPLGAVLANAETAELLMEQPEPDRSEIGEILVDIKRDSLRASEVIAGLRRLLKKAEPELQDVDLNQVVDDVFRFAAVRASQARVELVKDIETRPTIVRGDAIQLQQVVLNIVINAIEAVGSTAEGSRTVVGRISRPEPAIAEISIADTGPGLPEDDLRGIFNPFYSTKPEGMGMGLSIARTIVERHGGSITAEHRATGGSLFRVRLPVPQAAMTTA